MVHFYGIIMPRKSNRDSVLKTVQSGGWRRLVAAPQVEELNPLLADIRTIAPPRMQRRLLDEFNSIVISLMDIQSTVNTIVQTVQPGSAAALVPPDELRQTLTDLPNGLGEKLASPIGELTRHFQREKERTAQLRARVEQLMPTLTGSDVVAAVEEQVAALLDNSDAHEFLTLTEQIEAAREQLVGKQHRVRAADEELKALNRSITRRRETDDDLRRTVIETSGRVAALGRLERKKQDNVKGDGKTTVIPHSERAFIDDSEIGIVPLLGYTPAGEGKFVEPGGDELLAQDFIVRDALQRQRNGVLVLLKNFFNVTRYSESKREKNSMMIATTIALPRTPKVEATFTEIPEMTVRFKFVPGVAEEDFEIEIEAGRGSEKILPNGSARNGGWNLEIADPSKPREASPMVLASMEQAAQKIFVKFRELRRSLYKLDTRKAGPADPDFLRDLGIEP
jgi:hypothetical protein